MRDLIGTDLGKVAAFCGADVNVRFGWKADAPTATCLSVSKRPPVKLSILRDIGWREWDPIGLAGIDGEWASTAPDEYDTYLMQVVGRIRNGEQHDRIVDYLTQIETEHMGLSPVPTTRPRAEATVAAIREYLATIP